MLTKFFSSNYPKEIGLRAKSSLAILIAGAAIAFFRSHPPAFPTSYIAPEPNRPAASQSSIPRPDIRTITVTVSGEVEHPGPLTLIEGTTLKGLFEAARPTANAYIQHADYSIVLQDGDAIHIPPDPARSKGRILLSDDSLLQIRIRTAAAGPLKSDGPSTRQININRADAETLQTLPRIGPDTARRIIEERDAHGPFKKKEDLMRIRGIGRKTFKWLEPLITVE